MKRVGLDIGSTTLKCVIIEGGEILYSEYARHLSRVSQMTADMLERVSARFPGERMALTLSGSAGVGMAHDLGIPFVQEVYATKIAAGRLSPGTDTIIELGGEDAKILFLTNGLEVRMNGSCAGGTGAFIDQMAYLMNVPVEELDRLAAAHEKVYTVASRCGVFAKSDIQPLINQGAKLPDIAASIFYAVVNQTVCGLAQGREIGGRVLYLGGPLTFFPELRRCFDKTLGLSGTCPEHSLFYVALGAAYSAAYEVYDIAALSHRIRNYSSMSGYNACRPLFSSSEEYKAFRERHEQDSGGIRKIDTPADAMYLGIDAGSTTVKAALCDGAGNILDWMYRPNDAHPVELVREYLEAIYSKYPDINIVCSAATGYGEELIRHAFNVDFGVVETIAHFTAAKKFMPNVDFIIDIGGQDIKCFKIHNGAIDNIFLNEACSSGCGSFLQTFAGALGYEVGEFSRLGIYADMPVNLGSRCTVFMNSAVKQAQKDGASIENISAGLSISIVKNALYKVIRCATPDSLGQNIVVQGGTFLSDAVLRAFEQEVGRNVIRPSIAGLMGAYGAALRAAELSGGQGRSSILGPEQLARFEHTVRMTSCTGCSNCCQLTINSFREGERYIAGNRCGRPLKIRDSQRYNLYEYKNELLAAYRKNDIIPGRPTIGIPMGLNMYELLPFWSTLFSELGFNVVVSPVTDRELYISGQHTIPSDTVCFPAKLMHGHVEALLGAGVDAVFYPNMSYNFDEGLGHNHYNCPVVAYYPQVIKFNVKALGQVKYIGDFLGPHNRRAFPDKLYRVLNRHFGGFTRRQVMSASRAAYEAYESHMRSIREKADEYLKIAGEQGLPVIVLAGRPYHIDPEISHGIDRLACELGAVVLSEDGVSARVRKFKTGVLNQWTYHARLYAAAKFVARSRENIHLVQLVSFGCGVDAVTSDEVRSILESAGKIYTQIKIDDITNIGAAKIRLRSLFAAAGIEEKN
jgi:predicted CoA-substrate-specific enzyme activase